MRRNLGDVVFSDQAGTEDAHRAAQALADRFDAQTIITFTNAMTFLKEMGGQIYVVTLRDRIDAEGNLVSKDAQGSEWRTLAMRFVYETQDARVDAAKAPKDVLGIPVTEFQEDPVHIEPDVAFAAPDVEQDVRDEIEAEADAAAQPEEETVGVTD